MPFTRTQLQALETLIAQGVSQVKYQDREVRYQDLEKLLQLREKIAQVLVEDEHKSQRVYAQFRSGL